MKTSEEMQSIMYEIGEELEACVCGFDFIFEEVFGGISPSSNYTNNYKQLQSMFWLFSDTLSKFAGKFSLLTGEDDNPRIKNEFDQIKTLYDMNSPAIEQK